MRRSILIGVLAFAAFWPLAHRLMAARYEINPWKLGGWAMYTTAPPPVLVALFTKAGSGFAPVSEEGFSHRTRATLERFQKERHALGLLREPQDVSRRILEDRRDLSAIVIVVQRARLDPQTALIVTEREVYEYDRAASLR